jgi:class 3 adenylate cyclase/WD40 repeat protein
MTDVTASLLHGRYEVLAVVGRGGEGTLVRAVDRRHGRDVALKLRRVPEDPRDADRLLVEARTLLQLHPHPGLPLARDDFFEDDRHALVMDWVDGVDLGALLTEHGQPGLPPSTVLRWLAPAAEALTHLHTTDPPVVHGDVKPANLILTTAGGVVLVDFGVSSTRGLRPRGGTPGYRAPEVAAGAVPTRAADVYGLAATAFALLTGAPPSGILPAWGDVEPDRAAHLERALRRGLATDPAHRTASPGELVEELRAGWDSEPLPTGVVTFLATDVVASTRLWQDTPDAAPGLLAEHLLVVDRAVERHGGRRIGEAIQGDATMSVFHRAGDAVRAGVDLQRALAGGRVQVHCAVHTGEAVTVDGTLAGATLSRVARIRALADAGQVLVSSTTARLTTADLGRDLSFVELGPHRLDGFDQTDDLFAVDAPGLVVPPDPARPPYRGLLPYDVDDDEAFFGRDHEVDVCLQRIAEMSLMAVVGPSGSGKSSLVRAGIASRLRRAGTPVTVLIPGSDPLSSLAAATDAGTPATVLVVDQLEQLFAPGVTPEVADQFLDVLVAHTEAAAVIVTLRGDHVGSLARHPAFARRFEAGLHLVTPMTPDELREVIERPAHAAGLRLEAGLVELLLRDVEGEPGGLPLLSFALAQTWSNRDGRTLTVAGYHATGGLRQAIATSAERLYEDLPPRQRTLARALFLRLVTPGPDGEVVRHRIDQRAVLTDQDHRRVVDVFVRTRLVVTSDDGLELAHEALVRGWPRLQGWLDDDVDGQRVLHHLAAAAEAWDAMGRPDSELYRGARLAQASEWVRDAEPDLTPLEGELLEASRALAEAERTELETRARQQARANRRLRVLLGIGSVALVAAILAGLVAVVQSRRAIEQRDAAAAGERRAALTALVDQALVVRASKRDLAALLALEAWRLDPGPKARSALLGAFTRDPGFVGYIRAAGDEPGFWAGVVRPDGATAWVADADGVVHVIDLEGFADTGRVLEDPGIDTVFFSRMSQSADGAVVAQIVSGSTGGWGEQACPPGCFEAPGGDDWLVVYDGASGALRYPPVPLDFNVGDVAVSFDGRWVVTAGGDRAEAVIFESATGREIARVPGLPRPPTSDLRFNTAAVVFDRAGQLYVSSEAGPIRVIDPSTWTPSAELPPPLAGGNVSQRLAITPDGATLVGASLSGTTIAAWDVAAGRLLWSRGESDRNDAPAADLSCDSLAVAAAQDAIFCGTQDGVVGVFDLKTGERSGRRLDLGQGWPSDLLVAPDGSTLVTIGAERAVIGVWRVDGSGPITRVIPPGLPQRYSPDGRLLLTSEDADGPPDVWDPAEGRLVDSLEGVLGAAWSSRPSWLGAVFSDGTAGVYDVGSGQRVWSDPLTVEVLGAAADPVNDRSFVWAGDGSRQFVDQATGRFVGPDLQPGETYTAAFTSDGRHLAISGPDGVSVYDASTGARVAGPAPHGWILVAEDLLMRTGDPGRVHFHDPVTLAPRGGALEISTSSFQSFGLSDDGSLLMAGDGARTVRLFDVASRVQLGDAIELPRRTVFAALRPDGGELAVESTHGTALWTLDPDLWARAACRLAGRNLTTEEWDTYLGDLAPYRATCPAEQQT